MAATGEFKPGEELRWNLITDPNTSGGAVVTAVKTDLQEGMSPEIEDYVSTWIEARGSDGARDGESFRIMRSTEYKYYIDGEEIVVSAR